MAGGHGTTFANDQLKLFFLGTAISLIADNTATTPLTNLWLTLHTASPSGGTGSTSAAAYTSYVYKQMTRDNNATTGFNVSGATVALQALTSWAAATGGSETETHFAVVAASSGAAKILYWGTITPNIAVANGVTPQMTTAVFGTLAT